MLTFRRGQQAIGLAGLLRQPCPPHSLRSADRYGFPPDSSNNINGSVWRGHEILDLSLLIFGRSHAERWGSRVRKTLDVRRRPRCRSCTASRAARLHAWLPAEVAQRSRYCGGAGSNVPCWRCAVNASFPPPLAIGPLRDPDAPADLALHVALPISDIRLAQKPKNHLAAGVGARLRCSRVGAMGCSTAPLTEPDMRARIRLFGSVHQRASMSWSDACRGLSSSHLTFNEVSRPLIQDGG